MKKMAVVPAILLAGTTLAIDRNGFDNHWGMVGLSAACFRTEPAHSSELASQGSHGMPLRLIERNGEWWLAEMPDGYTAYVNESSIVEMTEQEMQSWRESPRLIVTSFDEIKIYSDTIAPGPDSVVSDAVNGCIFRGQKSPGVYAEIELPDGRTGYIANDAVNDFGRVASGGFDPQLVLSIAYSMCGTPYLWGGTTTKALDCSGLVKVAYFASGIILARNASQQAYNGEEIDFSDIDSLMPGDLLFFSDESGEKITHVGIYDNSGLYVHSSGRVKINGFDPSGPMFLDRKVVKAVRVAGNEGAPGIMPVDEHPWYF